MQTIIKQMIAKYPINSPGDEKNALKEAVQEVALCGLSRAGFFKVAAFYGGTALRIFYGLADSGYIKADFNLNRESLIKMLNDRFASIDFEQAKQDVLPFIKDKSKLDFWSAEFFTDITKNLNIILT